MKVKRLDRDSWGFQFYPYYQMRVDCDIFHGMVCLIRMTDGETNYWDTPKAGRVAVTGAGMCWLQLVPDGEKRVITVKYFPDGTHDEQRMNYPAFVNPTYQTSIWYVDVSDGMAYDHDGVIQYTDLYLDVIFTPEGDVKVDDQDELEQAYASSDITKEQYEGAIAEKDRILMELCDDIPKTEAWCANIRALVEKRIEEGEKPMFLYHGSQYLLDEIMPQQANGQSPKESLCAIYAAASAKDVIPFSLPIRWYQDGPSGRREFSCSNGKVYIEYGTLNPNGEGYLYKMKSDSFTKIDEWQWVSYEARQPVTRIPVKVKDFWDRVEFSEEARKINETLYGKSDL